MGFEDVLADWDGEEVVVRFNEPTQTWMFIGVHSTVLGPAMGGTRMKAYAAPGDGLSDVLRLSQAMTFKQAAAHLPYGGGKAVLAVPTVPPPGSSARREILLRYAALVDSLHGTYVTAADMNTGGGLSRGPFSCVMTATTPVAASALAVSNRTILPLAMVEWTSAA